MLYCQLLLLFNSITNPVQLRSPKGACISTQQIPFVLYMSNYTAPPPTGIKAIMLPTEAGGSTASPPFQQQWVHEWPLVFL